MKRILLATAATIALTGVAAAFDGGRDTYPVDPLTSPVQNVQTTPRVDPMPTASITSTTTVKRDYGAEARIEAAKKFLERSHR